MGRKHKRDEAVRLLKQGFSPSQIAAEWDISFTTVRGYLSEMVGEGVLRHSDILFGALLPEARQLVEAVPEIDEFAPHEALNAILTALEKAGILEDSDDMEWYLELRHRRVYLGDLYEEVREFEINLHNAVRFWLIEDLGADDSGWWRKGVPERIRSDCAARLERDAEPADHPYQYTFLIELGEILSANWVSMAPRLSKEVAGNKKGLLSDLTKVNQIRNRVMHPTREVRPSLEEYEFLRGVSRRLALTPQARGG